MPKRNDYARLWLEMEDELFPALSFDAVERVIYYLLFSRSHLLGRRTVRISVAQIAKATQLSIYLISVGIKNLRAKGCLQLHHRSQWGTLWELALPRKILGRKRRVAAKPPVSMDSLDCRLDPRARAAILRRERGYCFYCLRRITRISVMLDHVVPQSRGGGSSFRNIVACCRECNLAKGTKRAANFLRILYRKGRVNSTELSQRLSALARLTRGELRISLAA